MILNGKNSRISYNGKQLYHAIECSLQIDTDSEDIASKDTEGKDFVLGDYAWTMATNGYYATLETGDTTHITNDDLIGHQLAKDILDVEFLSPDGKYVYSGKIGITSTGITATNGTSATGTHSFKGKGNLLRALIED